MHRYRTTTLLLTAFALHSLILVGQLRAQSYDDQAKSILALFDAGKADTAYALIEPLKRSARFVPAILYARAHMTPDDRALPLYKEAIALEPGGPWADRACFALVLRYVEKGDSSASATWLGVLSNGYPRSSYIQRATEIVDAKHDWIAFDDGTDKPTPRKNGDKPKPTKKGNDTTRPKGGGATQELRGYALQVGLLPTREAAEQRASQVRAVGLNPSVFPKVVGGKKNYAVVVGPYESVAAANKQRTEVSRLCNCKAFTVRVE